MTDQATTQGTEGGNGAGGAQPWFPETEKAFVEGKGWKAPTDVLTSYKNLETLVGAEKAGRTVVLPKDEKDAEGLKAFRAKIGVPEKPEDYALPFPSGDSGEFAKLAASWMHEAGIPKAAAVKLTENFNKHFGEALKADQEKQALEHKTQIEGLKTEWGAKAKENEEFARRFLSSSTMTEDEITQFAAALGPARMLKLALAWGTKLGEHTAADGDGKGGFGMSVEQAQKALDALRADRMANKITQKEFLEKAEGFGKIISPEKAA